MSLHISLWFITTLRTTLSMTLEVVVSLSFMTTLRTIPYCDSRGGHELPHNPLHYDNTQGIARNHGDTAHHDSRDHRDPAHHDPHYHSNSREALHPHGPHYTRGYSHEVFVPTMVLKVIMEPPVKVSVITPIQADIVLLLTQAKEDTRRQDDLKECEDSLSPYHSHPVGGGNYHEGPNRRFQWADDDPHYGYDHDAVPRAYNPDFINSSRPPPAD
ncbi:hypothetical protein DFJ58DRAFT_733096 [Suillus subalutaceus]|uniref:uncharacterized protein n=1 Tax=Suillus subalutaceus TaxID=48586 RepID=UPI001B86D75D|nr:uncharacterized protein DFJ58DRAFT_733096 [Suillus subalutaceus]KAG1840002.1 hypothetical protein DFJ58DRAFT_733096 [Suillus subalutaceus]